MLVLIGFAVVVFIQLITFGVLFFVILAVRADLLLTIQKLKQEIIKMGTENNAEVIDRIEQSVEGINNAIAAEGQQVAGAIGALRDEIERIKAGGNADTARLSAIADNLDQSQARVNAIFEDAAPEVDAVPAVDNVEAAPYEDSEAAVTYEEEDKAEAVSDGVPFADSVPAEEAPAAGVGGSETPSEAASPQSLPGESGDSDASSSVEEQIDDSTTASESTNAEADTPQEVSPEAPSVPRSW